MIGEQQNIALENLKGMSLLHKKNKQQEVILFLHHNTLLILNATMFPLTVSIIPLGFVFQKWTNPNQGWNFHLFEQNRLPNSIKVSLDFKIDRKKGHLFCWGLNDWHNAKAYNSWLLMKSPFSLGLSFSFNFSWGNYRPTFQSS